jgi:hypothetical protein
MTSQTKTTPDIKFMMKDAQGDLDDIQRRIDRAFEKHGDRMRRDTIEKVLSAIDREINYHEYLEEQGEPMRHPVLACKVIAGYVRALKETK